MQKLQIDTELSILTRYRTLLQIWSQMLQFIFAVLLIL